MPALWREREPQRGYAALPSQVWRRGAESESLPMRKQDEAGIVEAIRDALELRGYLCQRVNQRRADLSGSDVVPDLLVSREKWDTGVWIGGEVKTQTGRLSKRRPSHKTHYGYSQADLFERGRIYVWRSAEEALSDINRFEAKLNLQRGRSEEDG